VVVRLAAEHGLPPENLIAPDSVRRLAWTPPEDSSADAVAEILTAVGVRSWQIGLLAAELAATLPDPPEEEEEEEERGEQTGKEQRGE
jgi:ribonuclease D